MGNAKLKIKCETQHGNQDVCNGSAEFSFLRKVKCYNGKTEKFVDAIINIMQVTSACENTDDEYLVTVGGNCLRIAKEDYDKLIKLSTPL